MNPTTRRPAVVAAIAAALLLSATSCLPVDHAGAEMTIVNQTDHRLNIHTGDDEFLRSYVQPNGTWRLGLNGDPPDCTEWAVRVITEDGTRSAVTGPPVCHGDAWIITDADLHPIAPDQ